jgi:gentisate 1,2-dioxygenase
MGGRPSSPLAAYRWEHTDRALVDQLTLEAEGHPATVEAGHAAVRFSNPTTGGDVLPTIRADFHRLLAGTVTAARREVGSKRVAGLLWPRHRSSAGWSTTSSAVTSWSCHPGSPTKSALKRRCFRFSDAPVFEALSQYRHQTGRSIR